MIPIFRAILSVLVLMGSLNCYSDITIVTPDNSRGIEIAKKIEKHLSIKSEITHETSPKNDNTVIITVGTNSFNELTNTNNRQIIASFIPYTTHIDKDNNDIYPFFSEPSPYQISSFFSEHFSSTKVGILYSDSDIGFLQELKREFAQTNNTLIAIKHNKRDVFGSIRALVRKDIEIMLLTKNKDIYENKKISAVIEALTRRRIPAISTSKSLLRAGASVSIAPNEDETINAIADLAEQLHNNPKQKAPYRIRKRSTTVNSNKSMMRIFNLNITSGDIK